MTCLKSQRKRKTKNPCDRCFLHRQLCICAVIPSLDLSTRLTLVIHSKELKRTTNTGRLAVHSLINSQMIVRGQLNGTKDLQSVLTPAYTSYLLYPTEDAIELADVLGSGGDKPIQLIVPDGNWRQAAKVSTRYPELNGIPRVKFSQVNVSSQHLRKEHFAEGLSTLEAIAFAFGVIEGPEVQKKLMDLYDAKLAATLTGRGMRKEKE